MTLFLNFFRMVCVTGQSSQERTDIVEVDVDQSGIGPSKESFSYLVSVLQIYILLLISAFCSVRLDLHILLLLRSLVPHWESLLKCVS